MALEKIKTIEYYNSEDIINFIFSQRIKTDIVFNGEYPLVIEKIKYSWRILNTKLIRLDAEKGFAFGTDGENLYIHNSDKLIRQSLFFPEELISFQLIKTIGKSVAFAYFAASILIKSPVFKQVYENRLDILC